MTEQEKKAVSAGAVAYSGSANGRQIEQALAWAARAEHDYRMLQEVLAGRLAVLIDTDRAPVFRQIGPSPAEQVMQHFDREYAAGG